MQFEAMRTRGTSLPLSVRVLVTRAGPTLPSASNTTHLKAGACGLGRGQGWGMRALEEEGPADCCGVRLDLRKRREGGSVRPAADGGGAAQLAS